MYTAAEKLMASKTASVEHTRKEKREAEGDGRDLLVAYLSDVGGYDRNYRDVEDQDESGSSGNIVEITYNCQCACGLHFLLFLNVFIFLIIQDL